MCTCVRPWKARPKVTSSAYSRFRDVDTHGRKQADHVSCGRFAFEVGVGCDHAFAHVAGLEPGEELFDTQLVWADPSHGVDCPAQHVVEPSVFASALNRDDIFGFFDHTDHALVAARVLADRALFTLGDVSADFAEVDAPLHFSERTG